MTDGSSTSKQPAATTIPVVAGVLLSAHGYPADPHVLVAQRSITKSYPLWWEFPGGKVETSDASFPQALRRELREELGVTLDIPSLLPLPGHGSRMNPPPTPQEPQELVEYVVSFYLVPAWTGTPEGKEGQVVEWIPVRALGEIPLLPSNRGVIKHIQAHLCGAYTKSQS